MSKTPAFTVEQCLEVLDQRKHRFDREEIVSWFELKQSSKSPYRRASAIITFLNNWYGYEYNFKRRLSWALDQPTPPQSLYPSKDWERFNASNTKTWRQVITAAAKELYGGSFEAARADVPTIKDDELDIPVEETYAS